MEASTIFIISIIALIIWCFILVNIIERGSRAKQIEQKLESQALLLANLLDQVKKQTLLASNIAEKQGVTSETISNILYPDNKS